MNQQDYIRAVEEMKIPATKTLEWVNKVKDKYYGHYNETNRQHQETVLDLFGKVDESSKKLINLIPQVQPDLQTTQSDSTRTLQIFTHILAGPIITIRDYTKLILNLPFWLPETEQTENEREHIRYIQKIQSAADYLWSLDRDVVLKMHIENFHE